MYGPGGNVLAKVNGISSRSTSSQLRFATNDRPMIDESPLANYHVFTYARLYGFIRIRDTIVTAHGYVGNLSRSE